MQQSVLLRVGVVGVISGGLAPTCGDPTLLGGEGWGCQVGLAPTYDFTLLGGGTCTTMQQLNIAGVFSDMTSEIVHVV